MYKHLSPFTPTDRSTTPTTTSNRNPKPHAWMEVYSRREMRWDESVYYITFIVHHRFDLFQWRSNTIVLNRVIDNNRLSNTKHSRVGVTFHFKCKFYIQLLIGVFNRANFIIVFFSRQINPNIWKNHQERESQFEFLSFNKFRHIIMNSRTQKEWWNSRHSLIWFESLL